STSLRTLRVHWATDLGNCERRRVQFTCVYLHQPEQAPPHASTGCCRERDVADPPWSAFHLMGLVRDPDVIAPSAIARCPEKPLTPVLQRCGIAPLNPAGGQCNEAPAP